MLHCALTKRALRECEMPHVARVALSPLHHRCYELLLDQYVLICKDLELINSNIETVLIFKLHCFGAYGVVWYKVTFYKVTFTMSHFL